MAASMMVVALVGAASASASASTKRASNPSAAQTKALLGTVNQAKGTPVKIGVLSAGKSETSDNTTETPVSQATVKWLNKYQNGLGGHPIELDICNDEGDPSKGTDCANQLIADGVAAVVSNGTSVLSTEWKVLHDAGIPFYGNGSGDKELLTDTKSTFLFSNGYAVLADYPIALAKAAKSNKVTTVLIDVPAAIAAFKNPDVLAVYKKAKVNFDTVPVAVGTADMTPQMQEVVNKNPKGVVTVIGTDAFCIAAFNGLRTAGFKGTPVAMPVCITDATRKAVPGDFMKRVKIGAQTPSDDPTDPSIKQFEAVLKTFGSGINAEQQARALPLFGVLGGLSASTQGLKGDPTPANIIAATKAAPMKPLPGSGGQQFRCNGKATTLAAAACVRSLLSTTLNSKGLPGKYTILNDTPIEN